VTNREIPWRATMALASVLVVFAQVISGAERDPHRPVCATTRCTQIKSYVKAHYCGESPYGNGPDDGCEIVRPKAAQADLEVVAQWSCDWDEQKRERTCRQQGRPPAPIRTIIAREMRRLGLQTAQNAQIKFTVLKSTSAGWSVAEGTYYRLQGENATSCQVVVTVDSSLRVNVLRQHRCHKENPDASEGTSWSPLGIADVDGDGQPDIILEGDEYENHWLEVVGLRGASLRTIFSGLGYYL
jgi:hypothetical protein